MRRKRVDISDRRKPQESERTYQLGNFATKGVAAIVREYEEGSRKRVIGKSKFLQDTMGESPAKAPTPRSLDAFSFYYADHLCQGRLIGLVAH